ncbi:thermonuclease family protein [Aeromonas caviae]|uniref:Thermonuclease family protein n=1 Tax=Aeromonas caviae TaxID=648 RepID=A0AAJ5ZEP5_AERCA|nr:thermonuclease family protein [Aeromonas caviae]WFG00246.1 thermonuclease family protein [Aeromonas caviae]
MNKPIFALMLAAASLHSAVMATESDTLIIIRGTVTEVKSPSEIVIVTASNKKFDVRLAWAEPPRSIDKLQRQTTKTTKSTSNQMYADKYTNRYQNQYSNQFTPNSSPATVQALLEDPNMVFQPGYERALTITKESLGRTVDCEVTNERGKGAILCDVYSTEGTWYNAELVSRGYATVTDTAAPSELMAMLKAAKKRKLGLWRAEFTTPSEWEARTRRDMRLSPR